MKYKEAPARQFVYGIHSVMEAIKEGKEIEKLMMQKGLSSKPFGELWKLIRERSIPYQFVPIEKLNSFTSKNHQGVICFLSEITYQSIEDILPNIFESGKVPLLLLLDRITDVRNFGSISRSAECAGVHAIIIPNRGSAQINADAIKTSSGALHSIPVCRTPNLKETIQYLKESGIQIIACTEKAKDYYYTLNLSHPTAILMGSEENGISPEYLKQSDCLAKIPLLGKIGSLNVSVATGIILYEAVRQRNFS